MRLNDGGSLAKLARDLGLGERQLRRAVRQEYGVSPIELAQTRRLSGQATADGVGSADCSGGVRQRVRQRPTVQRPFPVALPPDAHDHAATSPKAHSRDSFRLTLAYRPPLAWEALLRFLSGRSTAGVEQVEPGVSPDGRRRASPRLVEGRAGRRAEYAGRRAGHVADARSAGGPRPAEEPPGYGRGRMSSRTTSGPPSARRPVGRNPGLRVPGRSTASRWPGRASLGQRIRPGGDDARRSARRPVR